MIASCRNTYEGSRNRYHLKSIIGDHFSGNLLFLPNDPAVKSIMPAFKCFGPSEIDIFGTVLASIILILFVSVLLVHSTECTTNFMNGKIYPTFANC